MRNSRYFRFLDAKTSSTWEKYETHPDGTKKKGRKNFYGLRDVFANAIPMGINNPLKAREHFPDRGKDLVMKEH